MTWFDQLRTGYVCYLHFAFHILLLLLFLFFLFFVSDLLVLIFSVIVHIPFLYCNSCSPNHFKNAS